MREPAAYNKKWVGTERLQELTTPTEGIALQIRQLVERIFQKTELLYLYFLQNLYSRVRTHSSGLNNFFSMIHASYLQLKKPTRDENIWL